MHSAIHLPAELGVVIQMKLSDGRTVSLGIWDTAGAERFQSLSRMYYSGARAALVCVDSTNAGSFEKMKFWVRQECIADRMQQRLHHALKQHINLSHHVMSLMVPEQTRCAEDAEYPHYPDSPVFLCR